LLAAVEKDDSLQRIEARGGHPCLRNRRFGSKRPRKDSGAGNIVCSICPDPCIWRRSADNEQEPTGTGLLCRPRARNCLRIDEERPRNDGNRRGPTHPTLLSQGDVTVCQTLLYSGSTPDWLQREFLALCNRSLIGYHMIRVALGLGRLLRPLPRYKWQTRRVLSRGRGDTANIGGI